MELAELNQYLTQVLQPEKFSDYCPNGLQVEGRKEIKHIVTGVTASMALLEAANQLGADAVLVHHGYFWRGERQQIIGLKQRRIKFLLQHDINLFAYHLPLDAHPELGNNVMLGKLLGLPITGYLDDKGMLPFCTLEKATSLQVISDGVSEVLGRKPQTIGDMGKIARSIAWCTGAAQQYIEQAIEHNIDVFISGEISEQTVHLARESGTAYIAAGHHATERYGIRALGEYLAGSLGLRHTFIDIDNPI
ncbi:MAG TPA: Nif3-like dinuclear metal center hexameric protein [Methylophilus sp.]|nr:Nif3-like dinuclear metal center hexameric protein [Methylophilus sp.]HQQ34208.1 Nif3-like dinuclear metal center hexameric protein [Methylophilus sp.]